MDNIHKKLMEIGMPTHILGFQYCHDALQLEMEDKAYQHKIIALYHRVATMNSTTGLRVERAIRHAVEVAFDRIPIDTQVEIFGASVSPGKGKPTNKEFLSAMALAIGEVTS